MEIKKIAFGEKIDCVLDSEGTVHVSLDQVCPKNFFFIAKNENLLNQSFLKLSKSYKIELNFDFRNC